jgi:uncharacterized protein YjbI with pentapeptide repeats
VIIVDLPTSDLIGRTVLLFLHIPTDMLGLLTLTILEVIRFKLGFTIQVGIEAADTIVDVKRFIVADPVRFLGTANRIHWRQIVLVYPTESGDVIPLDTSSASTIAGKDVNIFVKDLADILASNIPLRIIDDVRSDMRHINLNLTGRDLSFADLIGCKLSTANLSGADLTGSDLGHAKLSNADLRGAILSGAKLREAHLVNADLTGAILSGADLRDAALSRVIFTRADLSRTKIERTTITRADLREANLRGADLTHADLRGAILSGADLTDADLRGAKIDNFSGVDLSVAKNVPAIVKKLRY